MQKITPGAIASGVFGYVPCTLARWDDTTFPPFCALADWDVSSFNQARIINQMTDKQALSQQTNTIFSSTALFCSTTMKRF